LHRILYHIGVNPGVRGRDPQSLGWGRGGRGDYMKYYYISSNALKFEMRTLPKW